VTACQGAGGTGTLYTYAQLEGLWIGAGGSQATAPVAAAIAMAESGGCSAALNKTDNNGTQTSVGLWQVSNGTHTYPTVWTTATGNAAEAVAKYQGAGGFSPWGTYDSGAYKQFVSGSTTPDMSAAGTSATLDSSTSNGSTSGGDAGCLLQIGGGSVLGISNPLNVCLITHKGAREIIGGLLLAGAGIVGIAAAVILAASAFQHSGAGRAVQQAVPPVRAVVNVATPGGRAQPRQRPQARQTSQTST
jgi:hypothetical protein